MLVAGEASGDQHAANLVQELRARVPEAICFGFGGEMMASSGVEVVHNLVSHAVIGIAEAVRKLGDFFKILQQAGNLLQQRHPDVLVLTDLPDLNFRIAAKAKALGIPVIYYISPQVWAWRRGRVKTLKRLVDKMIVIFPFEEPIYQKAGVPVSFVGHPLLDIVKTEIDPKQARSRLLNGSSGPLIALVPGSRSQEIEMLLSIMAQAGLTLRHRFPEARFFLPLAKTISRRRVETILAESGLAVEIVTKEPYAARAAADLAVVSSGTATLETAILGVPMLIGYRMHALSYFLARIFVKLPYFGLANLVAGEKIAPEFLQDDFNCQNIAEAAGRLLTDSQAAERQRRSWVHVRERLGGAGAAGRAAEEVLKVLRKDH